MKTQPKSKPRTRRSQQRRVQERDGYLRANPSTILAAQLTGDENGMRVAIPMALHRDTKKLVVFFAAALARKLLKAEQKYGFSNEWAEDEWGADCIRDINLHLEKGDPLDVAAYAAFAWFHNWKLNHQKAMLGGS